MILSLVFRGGCFAYWLGDCTRCCGWTLFAFAFGICFSVLVIGVGWADCVSVFILVTSQLIAWLACWWLDLLFGVCMGGCLFLVIGRFVV